MAQNFQKAKIYKITNDYNDDVYVGSTCDTLIKRFSTHKYNSNYEKIKTRPIYKLMNEIGIERFRIDLIEDYPCNDKQALRQREGHFIREMGSLNIRIDGRTDKEYRIDNIEKIKELNKQYYIGNVDKFKEYNNQYYIDNIDIIKEQKRQYQNDNADKIKEHKKQYYQRKKLEMSGN